MKDDYIRKSDAVNALKAQADTMRTWVERYAEQRRGILTAVNIVEDIKPADVVQVVRCRKCKYFWAYRCMDSMPIEMCELGQTFYDPDRDFCSLAESKEG